IARVVRRVERRRARRSGVARYSVERTRSLIEGFRYLKPFIFSARERCLFESLVIIDFLAHHGVFANWVFGVRTAPFAAHCWVQQGEYLLNDSFEHVRSYTPIMSI